MICYRDVTFCPFYVRCCHGNTCHSALTPEVRIAADAWWGGTGAPICEYTEKPHCFLEGGTNEAD